MSTRFKNFGLTLTGRHLIEAIDTDDRTIRAVEFRLLSRPGIRIAAVQAVAEDVQPIIEALKTQRERNAANQFVGWFVGQRMREMGYRIVQERGRVKNATFKTGAVWGRS